MHPKKQEVSATGGQRAQGQSDAKRLKECGGDNLLDAGLRAAERGWKIFPCNGKKEPLTTNGFKDATKDPATITAWTIRWPGALWGLALPPDVVVIGLDMKHGQNGIKEFERLQGCTPEEFDAPRVATATGGMHVYTDAKGRDFKNSVGVIAPGIDTRTGGGYVIIPSGDGSYRWLTDPDTHRPPAPPWTESALRNSVEDFGTPVTAKDFQCASSYGDAILDSACDAITTAPDGKQQHTLNARSFVIGRYVSGGLIERTSATEALVEAGLQMINFDKRDLWTRGKIEATVKRAINDGMKQPLDGEEIFRAMDEVHRRFFAHPQQQRDLEELLEALDAQRDEWADAGHDPGEGSQDTKQDEEADQDKQGAPFGYKLIRRAGKGVPTPVPFSVD